MYSNIEVSLLYDFYGRLLNDAQRNVVELCVNDDLSLSEAADILNISRQGVHDSLTRAVDKLRSYENKLGLMKDFMGKKSKLDEINVTCDKIISLTEDREISGCAESIKNIVASLYEQGENNGF